MLIEKINSASFANGILRLQVATTNGRGDWVETGTLEIPGGLVTAVINQMSTAASDISDHLATNESSNDLSKEDKNGGKKSKKSSKDKK